MSVPDARERARAVLARGPVGSAAGHALARDVLALADENERLRELLEQAEVDTERKVDAEVRARLERAVAGAATLRQALEQIAALSAYVGPASDGSTMRGPWIARAALDSAATGDAA